MMGRPIALGAVSSRRISIARLIVLLALGDALAESCERLRADHGSVSWQRVGPNSLILAKGRPGRREAGSAIDDWNADGGERGTATTIAISPRLVADVISPARPWCVACRRRSSSMVWLDDVAPISPVGLGSVGMGSSGATPQALFSRLDALGTGPWEALFSAPTRRARR
jgi:hypothetical protein